MVYEISETKKIGIGLIGFAILFSFLGVILFLIGACLLWLFFLSGVGILLGWQSTWQLFTKKLYLKGSIPFFVGLFLIFVRWPIVGIVLEIYGAIVLFSGFGPSIKVFLSHIPVVGWLLQYPFQLFDHLRRLIG